jgi:hypothetical protein
VIELDRESLVAWIQDGLPFGRTTIIPRGDVLLMSLELFVLSRMMHDASRIFQELPLFMLVISLISRRRCWCFPAIRVMEGRPCFLMTPDRHQ